MAIVKPSKTVLEGKQRALARAKRDMRAAQVIAEGKDTPLWREIQAKVKPLIADAEAKLIEWEKQDERTLHALLATKAAFTRIYGLVDDMEAVVEIYAQQIETLEIEIEEYRARI